MPQKTESRLDFSTLRSVNVPRCETEYHPLRHWNVLEWAAAASGEMGEATNVAKKMRRGDEGITKKMIADEIADTIIYLDLLAAHQDIDLGEAITAKFNETSRKLGSPFRLPTEVEPCPFYHGPAPCVLASGHEGRHTTNVQTVVIRAGEPGSEFDKDGNPWPAGGR